MSLSTSLLRLVCLISISIFSSNALGETVSAPKLFSLIEMSAGNAKKSGYRQVSVDLGDPSLNFSTFVKEDVEVNVLEKVGKAERAEVATLFAPQERNAFAVSVIVFQPGFAAEAPSASEQVLFERGYGLAGSNHRSLVTAEAFGLVRDAAGNPEGAARSLCSTRGKYLLCMVMEFEADHEATAMEQAAVFVGSFAYEDGKSDAFATGQIRETTLMLSQNKSVSLSQPEAFEIVSNGLKGELPGILHTVHGSPENPQSILVIGITTGSVPNAAGALDAAAQKVASNYVKENAELFSELKLQSKGEISLLKNNNIASATQVYTVDKLKENGKAQIRVSLVADGSFRYSVLMTTHYSESVDTSEEFFARLAGITAYDLAIDSIASSINR